MYTISDDGLTVKWNIDKKLFSEDSVQDQLVKKLKFSLEGTRAPQTRSKHEYVELSY